MRTEVAIIGAGPAGLMLSHLLHRAGVQSVVLEARSRAHVEGRIRAGVLEPGTTALLHEVGLGERLAREGLRHEGIELLFEGERHRVDLTALTGQAVTVYGQHEVVRDLIGRRLVDGGQVLFEAEVKTIAGLETAQPVVHGLRSGRSFELRCAFVAGCDGFHGAARRSIPGGVLKIFEHVYPFVWLGVLAEAPPVHHELVYARHEEGFALLSMRSPTITRLYVQGTQEDDFATWPEALFWDVLERRLGARGGVQPTRGPILQRTTAALRSFVTEPMQHGRLFLAGDAAHIVPPTGAKGMNLAIADVVQLSRAMEAMLGRGDPGPLERYSATCLRRVWDVQRFSWWMTRMLHRFEADDAFERRRQRAELEHVVGSEVGLRALAEGYVGRPLGV